MSLGLSRDQREQLRSDVGHVRSVAEEAFAMQLRALAIWSDCSKLHDHTTECFVWPKGRLDIPSSELELRDQVLAAIDREAVGFSKFAQPDRLRRAVGRYVRSCAFTMVNRLAALRAMEVRGLVLETVARREKYGGLSLREWRLGQDHPSLTPDVLMQKSFEDAMKEAREKVAILFDSADPYALLWPDLKYVQELVSLLGERVTENLWLSDDILGWIYQYYNEETRRSYKRHGYPEPDEVPIINQFYTPRWLVRFLVDNTLGRLWLRLESEVRTPRDPSGLSQASSAREFCTYMVPSRKDESLGTVKRPEEIKILDPACGSGHFLLYAFDVLWKMWHAARPDLPDEAIATTILEHNLFGVDIDLRACQLAALGLFLKAKVYAPSMNVSALNIVCADVRILNGERKRAFVKRFENDPELRTLVERVLDTLGYTFEIGSLLKIRQPFEKLFRSRRAAKWSQAQFLKDQPPTSEEGKSRPYPPSDADLSARRDDSSRDVMTVPKQMSLEEVRVSLQQFEKETLDRHDMGGHLFATDLSRSVGLLSILSEEYDIVLMNPPYGDMPAQCKVYTRDHFPRTHSDFYSAFIEQAVDLCSSDGYVGALTGRTFLFLKYHQKLREQIFRFEAKPELMLDLGFDVLDGATARWAAFTLRKLDKNQDRNWASHEVIFFRLYPWQWDEKRVHYENALGSIQKGELVENSKKVIFRVTLGELAEVPGSPFSYWVPWNLRQLFGRFPPLDRDIAGMPHQPKIAETKVGLQTGDDERFTRFWWEVPSNQIALTREETFAGKHWVPLLKGGKPFFHDIAVVVNWKNDGEELRGFSRSSTGKKTGAVVQNESYYFREGLAWPNIVSAPRTDLHFFPSGCIFRAGTHALFAKPQAKLMQLLAWGNSRLVWQLFQVIEPLLHNKHIGYVSKLPVAPEVLNDEGIGRFAEEAIRLLMRYHSGDETSIVFKVPWMLQSIPRASRALVTTHPLMGRLMEGYDFQNVKQIELPDSPLSLGELADLVRQDQLRLKDKIVGIQHGIDSKISMIYGVQPQDLDQIKVLGEDSDQETIPSESPTGLDELDDEKSEPGKTGISQDDSWPSVPTSAELVRRLVSFYVKEILDHDEDGIVPVTNGFQDSLVPRLWEKFKEDFGSDRKEIIEKELEKCLGKPLERWIGEDYFSLHIRMYRNRPLYWLFSSNSGSSSTNYAFACLVRYLGLTSDTVPKIRTLYVARSLQEGRIRSARLNNEASEARRANNKTNRSQLSRRASEAREEVAELETFAKKLDDLVKPIDPKRTLPDDASWIQKKVQEVRQAGYRPNLDYGVIVNITPLKDIGLLHRDVNRVK